MYKEDIEKIITEWKKKNNIRLYTPFKYFKGLTTKKNIILRLEEMKERKNKKSGEEVEYKTDKIKKSTTKSKYHTIFEERFQIPFTSTMEEKSKVSGIPLDILKEVNKRGIGAWSSGHRVGVTKYQWGNARVSSFLTLGCSAFSGDYDLLKKIQSMKKNKKISFFLNQTPSCPKSKIKKFLG